MHVDAFKLLQEGVSESISFTPLHDRLCVIQVFMDYRFNPNMPHPEWYTPVDPKALEKMWASDRRDSAVQSLFESSW